MSEVYTCQACGSEDIEAAMWVDPNTKEVGDWYHSEGSYTQWCHTCDDHCFVVCRSGKPTKTPNPEKQKEVRWPAPQQTPSEVSDE